MPPSQNQKNQKEQKYETIVGGLKVKYPLSERPIDKIFSTIIENEFHLYLLDQQQRDKAIVFMQALQRIPSNINEYVEQQEIYSQLTWAYEKGEYMKKSCEDCTISQEASGLYMIESPGIRNFIIEYEVDVKMFIGIEPFMGTQSFQGQILRIDSFNDCLKVMCRAKIPPGIYSIYVLPSTLNYRSRMRTLKWITERTSRGKLGDKSINYYFFPSEREQHRVIPRHKAREHLINLSNELNFSDTKSFNEVQKVAITGIVKGFHGEIPYVLFGPPGTGKTHCLVESVRILCEANEKNKILVCASSNTAADLFTLELMKAKMPTKSIFRMFSLSKPVEKQNPLLQNVVYSLLLDKGERSFGIYPKQDLLEKFRVIVCTLSASTYLVTGGLQCCFTHIVVDEAGQADEIETLIPIIGLAGHDTKVILAGDPRQLGPVELCDKLKENYLKESLIERIVRYRHENRMHNDETCICMLEHNYRSHPALIEIPSKLFYFNLLKASAPLETKSSLDRFSGLPAKGFPIVFHSVESEEKREDNGYSYCNIDEADIVVNYVYKLLQETDVTVDEIGVITPYRFQIKKITEKLAKIKGYRASAITVDSVERFQGQERRVIIVSTVRNSGIGFLDSDKRFNTTVTRPQELLIIVGNHYNLMKIRSWHEYIDFCSENGGLLLPQSKPIIPVQKRAPAGRVPIFRGLHSNDSTVSLQPTINDEPTSTRDFKPVGDYGGWLDEEDLDDLRISELTL